MGRGCHGPGWEMDHPGIIYAYLLVVRDSVLIDSPVTAFQANKVKKPGGWLRGHRTTRPFLSGIRKRRLGPGLKNQKRGYSRSATRGCVLTGTTDETQPRSPGKSPVKGVEEKFRNELRKSEKNFECPR